MTWKEGKGRTRGKDGRERKMISGVREGKGGKWNGKKIH
jgi:hypothetical protein